MAGGIGEGRRRALNRYRSRDRKNAYQDKFLVRRFQERCPLNGPVLPLRVSIDVACLFHHLVLLLLVFLSRIR